MLRNPLTWLLLFIVSTTLAACCGSVSCDCPDRLDDALVFRFNLDTLSANSAGFRAAELQTVFVARVPRDTAQRPRADTVALVGGRRNLVQTVVINNAVPFPQSGTRKLDQYDYKIYLGARRMPRKSFQITNVVVEDEFVSDGCCTCNENLRKELTVDGRFYNLSDPEDQVVEVLLSR